MMPLQPGLAEGLLLLALAVPLAVVVRKDLSERRIPDAANLAIAALGLAWSWVMDPALVPLQFFDAALVGGFLLALRWGYRRWRGRTGLGLGDVKFLAAATLWTGLKGTATLLLVASLSAIVGLLAWRLARRPVGAATRIPFGPFLIAGFACALALQLAARPGAMPWPPL